MARDSEATKKRIMDALGRLIAEQGFKGVGVNAVARAAGVDKVLIYRYFGGLPELVRAYAEQGDFWPSMTDLLAGAGDDLLLGARNILRNHVRQLRSRPVTQEIMRWELLERNEMTDQLARAREETTGHYLDLVRLNGGEPQTRDLLAVAAVLYAGLTYLVLRAKTADVYMGVDLDSEDGWQRLEKAADDLVTAYFGNLPGMAREEER